MHVWVCSCLLKVEGGATSVSVRGEGHEIFIGTSHGNVYRCALTEFKPELRTSSHSRAISVRLSRYLWGVWLFPFFSLTLFLSLSHL